MPRVAMLVLLLWFCSHGLPQNSIICNISSTFVILVTVLVFLLMMTFAVLIWIGMEENPIDSSTVSRVYVDLFATAILLLGAALACYGLLLCRKMRNVRSERASSEIWKVAGLAIVSVLSFTSSALVALFTDIPVLYHWHELHIDGSSVPSAFVLWVMRELPPMTLANTQEESTTVTFITDSSAQIRRPQNWTTSASSQNQGLVCTKYYPNANRVNEVARFQDQRRPKKVQGLRWEKLPSSGLNVALPHLEIFEKQWYIFNSHQILHQLAGNVSSESEQPDQIKSSDCQNEQGDQKGTVADFTRQSEYHPKGVTCCKISQPVSLKVASQSPRVNCVHPCIVGTLLADLRHGSCGWPI
ncbi:hypothetical protein GOBAR_DD33661 [Gossypium barbadense]|nr:hypothetical protein GOBAR_DD33661 [Gossypium barbadense]